VVEPIDSVLSASLGIWCKTGSRHELDHEAGITHFIEHMLFKGTPTRNAKQIAEQIEGYGGVLNAFTDKEQTCYYCRILSDEIENATSVLSDMVCNSLLDPEEIARECGVILEEIKRGEDEPGDHVHELHITNLWGAHSLGKPIIGTKESVSSFKQPDFKSYMERRYRGNNIVIAIAGRVDPHAFRDIAERYLGGIPAGGDDPVEPAPAANRGTNEIADDVEQVHFCIGANGVGLFHPDLYVQSVTDAILGGGMSSRLFQEIRERRGLAYSVGSYVLPYSSGGAFTIYGGTSKDAWPQVQELAKQELGKIRNGEVSEDELTRIKRQISGNMVLALEATSTKMMRMAKNELHHQREVPIEETLEKVRAVSRDDIVRYASTYLGEADLQTTAIGPF
jgi:predicted Zn-dependent peptidase